MPHDRYDGQIFDTLILISWHNVWIGRVGHVTETTVKRQQSPDIIYWIELNVDAVSDSQKVNDIPINNLIHKLWQNKEKTQNNWPAFMRLIQQLLNI